MPDLRDQVVDASNVGQVGSVNVNAFPAGFQRVTDEPRQIFYDPFDAALDTTNRWSSPVSAGGGVGASVSAGVLTLGSGTTGNGYSYLASQASIVPTVPAWLGNSWAVTIEAGATAGNNATRFWGHGLVGGTPSGASPLGATGNGYGFEIDAAGVLQAVVYANGTRTAVASLAALQPTDGAQHRYIVFYRTDRIFWYIDGLAAAQLGATSNFQGPQIQTLPVLALAVAGATPPAASRVFTCNGVATWDTGKNSSTLSDGTYPWRKATVSAAGALSVSDPDAPSTVNSSTAVLAASGVFTGTSESRIGYASLQVSVFASHASATNGLSIQQSQDGTNWDTKDVFTIRANEQYSFQVKLVAEFFRVVYTNGATLQTTFRLEAVKSTAHVNFEDGTRHNHSEYAVATLTATTDAALVAAPGADLNLYIRSVMVTNTSATIARVDLKDGTTTKWQGAAAASGGGWSTPWKRAIRVTENTAFNGALSAAVTDVRVAVEYAVGT